MDGIEILKTVKRDNPGIPVVIISGHGNIELAVAAVKQGAYDFIEKPFNARPASGGGLRARSRPTACAARTRSLRARDARSSARSSASPTRWCSCAGGWTGWRKTGSRVMLAGGPGSGKEVCARLDPRQFSPRADQPFVVVNAASIEPERMEEVLFGRESAATAPTPAHEPGMFEKAHGGTLFIDEVADMPLGTQSKILRVLVDQSFTRLGGTSTVRVDVRVISANDRRICQESIREGRFREDLYHRLNVVPIEVPPLEARRSDIPLLRRPLPRAALGRAGLPPPPPRRKAPPPRSRPATGPAMSASCAT